MHLLARHVVLLGLFVVAGAASADPEMRCRLGGAYIKVYGKTDAERREVCARQGGELARYSPSAGQRGPSPSEQGMQSIFGRSAGGPR